MSDADKLNQQIAIQRKNVCLQIREQVRDFSGIRSYAQMRLETVKNSLCTATTMEEVFRLQGQARELRDLIRIEATVDEQINT